MPRAVSRTVLPVLRSRAEAHALAMTLFPRVARWAAGFRGKMVRNDAYPQGDAEGDCFLGIFHAAERFDESRGVQFSTYAFQWARQHMQRACVSAGRVVCRPVLSGHRKKMRPGTVARAGAGEIQMQQVGFFESDEWEPAVHADPAESLIRRETAEAVRWALRDVPAADRAVLERRLNGETFRQIAESMGLSTTRIQQREAAAKEKVFRRLYFAVRRQAV